MRTLAEEPAFGEVRRRPIADTLPDPGLMETGRALIEDQLNDLRELSFVVQPIVELAKQPHELFHLAIVQ